MSTRHSLQGKVQKERDWHKARTLDTFRETLSFQMSFGHHVHERKPSTRFLILFLNNGPWKFLFPHLSNKNDGEILRKKILHDFLAFSPRRLPSAWPKRYTNWPKHYLLSAFMESET